MTRNVRHYPADLVIALTPDHAEERIHEYLAWMRFLIHSLLLYQRRPVAKQAPALCSCMRNNGNLGTHIHMGIFLEPVPKSCTTGSMAPNKCRACVTRATRSFVACVCSIDTCVTARLSDGADFAAARVLSIDRARRLRGEGQGKKRGDDDGADHSLT